MARKRKKYQQGGTARRKQLQGYVSTQLIPYFQQQGMDAHSAAKSSLEYLKSNHPTEYKELTFGQNKGNNDATGQTLDAMINAFVGMVNAPQALVGEGLNTVLNNKKFDFNRAFNLDLEGKQIMPSEAIGIENPYIGTAVDMGFSMSPYASKSIVNGLSKAITKGATKGFNNSIEGVVSHAMGTPTVTPDQSTPAKLMSFIDSKIESIITPYQKKAWEKGREFNKNWFFGKDGKLRPEVKNKIKRIYASHPDVLKENPWSISIDQDKPLYFIDQIEAHLDNLTADEFIGDTKRVFSTPRETTVVDMLTGTPSDFNELPSSLRKNLINSTRATGGFHNTGYGSPVTYGGSHNIFDIDTPQGVMDVGIHEDAHMFQGIGRGSSASPINGNRESGWGSILSDIDKDVTEYFHPNPKSDLARAIGMYMPKGKKGERLWNGSIGELHSELMVARSKLVNKLLEANPNRSKDEIISHLQNPEKMGTKELDYLINVGDLNRFFLKSTPKNTKHFIINRILPGLGGGAYLNSTLDNNNSGSKEYQEGGTVRREQLQGYVNTQLIPYFQQQGMDANSAAKSSLDYLKSNFPNEYMELTGGRSIDSPTDVLPPDPLQIGNSYLAEAANLMQGKDASLFRPLTGDQQTLSESVGVTDPIGSFALDMLDPSMIAGLGAGGVKKLANIMTRRKDKALGLPLSKIDAEDLYKYLSGNIDAPPTLQAKAKVAGVLDKAFGTNLKNKLIDEFKNSSIPQDYLESYRRRTKDLEAFRKRKGIPVIKELADGEEGISIGSYAKGIYKVPSQPNNIIKYSRAPYGEDFNYFYEQARNLPSELKNNPNISVPKNLFGKESEKGFNSEMVEVLPRLSGKHIRKGINDKISEPALKEGADLLQKMKDNGLYFDYTGDNVLFDPVTQKLQFLDFSSDAIAKNNPAWFYPVAQPFKETYPLLASKVSNLVRTKPRFRGTDGFYPETGPEWKQGLLTNVLNDTQMAKHLGFNVARLPTIEYSPNMSGMNNILERANRSFDSAGRMSLNASELDAVQNASGKDMIPSTLEQQEFLKSLFKRMGVSPINLQTGGFIYKNGGSVRKNKKKREFMKSINAIQDALIDQKLDQQKEIMKQQFNATFSDEGNINPLSIIPNIKREPIPEFKKGRRVKGNSSPQMSLPMQSGGNIPVDPMGQFAHPNQPVLVPTPSGMITMDGVDQRLLAMDQAGNQQILEPNSGQYQFTPGMVLEIPMEDEKPKSRRKKRKRQIKNLESLFDLPRSNKGGEPSTRLVNATVERFNDRNRRTYTANNRHNKNMPHIRRKS